MHTGHVTVSRPCDSTAVSLLWHIEHGAYWHCGISGMLHIGPYPNIRLTNHCCTCHLWFDTPIIHYNLEQTTKAPPCYLNKTLITNNGIASQFLCTQKWGKWLLSNTKRMTDSMQFQSSSGNDHSTEECDKRKEKNLRYRKTYFEKGSYYLAGKG